MHFCYVITTTPGNSYYADLAYISVRALHKVHPRPRITILLDVPSAAILEETKHPILDWITDKQIIDTGMPDSVDSSRYLKTMMRSRLQGDFLFLDVDAVPVRSLKSIFELDCDIAAAIDNNYSPDRQQLADWVAKLYEKHGWTYDEPRYYNSGVIFFKDTPKAHEMGRLWHERWQFTRDRGCNKDQPSFNSLLPVVEPRMSILHPRFNAMVSKGIKNTRQAAVLHFWVSFSHPDRFIILNELCHRFKTTGQIDEELFNLMVNQAYSWVDPYWIKGQWHSGHYYRACIALGVKMTRRLSQMVTPRRVPAK